MENWYIDGDKIYNRYGGIYEEVYNGKRLSRSAFSDTNIENDTWIFEPISNLEKGIRLIDEYYSMIGINDRYMAIDSTKSLEDLKIRLLRYCNEDLTSPIWSSSNTNVATVDATTGDVTAVGVGNVTITVTQPGMLINNSASYTINVLPLKDGMYSITNKLGFDQLGVVERDGVFYLERSNNYNSNSNWYLQTTINGKYLISVVDNKNVGSNFILGSSVGVGGNTTTTYATLGELANNSSYIQTWRIETNELGYSLELEGEATSSMFILDANDSKVELGTIDYEDYEGMWR